MKFKCVFAGLAGLFFALLSLALSPARVDGEATVIFEKGAVALSAAQRQLLLREAARVLAQNPCKVQFGVFAYGDQGLPFAEMRSLALDRARYIQAVFKGARLNLPGPLIDVGGDLPREAKLLGTGGISVGGYIGSLGCE